MKGIYIIMNNINDKIYIGCSNDIKRRFMEHRAPKHIANGNTTLCRAFRKYSLENFSFYIVEKVSDISELPIREKYWINKYNPEYNMTEGGLGVAGNIVSDETKEVLRLSGKLQWMSMSESEKQDRIKNNLKGPRKGHPVSEETREKLRKANLGKKQSEETIRKRSESNKIASIGKKPSCKKVSAIKDGIIIKSFNSVKEGAKHFDVKPNRVSAALKGRQKTAGGVMWKYGV